MATTLTLADVQRVKAEKGDDFGAAIVDLVQRDCDMAAILDFVTLGTVEMKRRVSNSVGTVGFRTGRGQPFGNISGPAYDEVADQVFSLGAEIKMDKTDVYDKMAGDILGQRTRFAVRALSQTFNEYFVNGDHATDPHGFEGVKVRLANSPAGQVIYGVSSSAELDVRAAASPSESTLYTFLDKIDEAIDALDGHNGDIAITSSDFIATLRSVLRRLNKYTVSPLESPNADGHVARRTGSVKPSKPVLVYPEDKGIKWYDMGFKADQTTRIIGNETINSVGCRPVYFIKTGADYLQGIQQYPMEIDPLERLDDGVTWASRIDWPVGLFHAHKKTFSALSGVRVA